MSQTTELDRTISTDRTSQSQLRQTGGLENLDRVAMMKEARHNGRPSAGDGAGAAGKPHTPGKNGDVHFTNVYKETGTDKAVKPPAVQRKDPDAGGISVGVRSTAERLSPSSLRSRPEKIDPTKRNALVLDQFSDPDQRHLTDILKTKSHGGAIADGMRANHFNVYTADMSPPIGKASGNSDFGATFRDVAKKIDNGQIPLGKNDVITASFGNNATLDANGKPTGGDPTYAQASQMLKMNITPDNVQAQTPQIVDRLGKVAQALDPETGKPTQTSPQDQENAKLAYESNKAIQDLQNRGITVIAAAGNDGPDRLSMGALAATRMSSNDASGAPDRFSASDSGTTKADGVIPIKAVEPSLIDPTPLENQKEKAQIADGGRIIDAPVFGKPALTFDRSQVGPETSDNTKALMQSPQSDLSQTAFAPPEATPSTFSKTHLDIPPIFSQAGNRPGNISKVVDAKTQTVSPDAALTPSTARLVGVDMGTSFSVLDFTKEKADRNVPLFDQGR